MFLLTLSAVSLVDWQGRVQWNHHLPFPVSFAYAADSSVFLTVLRQCIFQFKKAKFSSYIRAVTHYILGGIIKIKLAVNSESEMILSPVFLFG